MKRILSGENYLQLQELTDAGDYKLQLGFALAGLTYKIENGNVKFYLKDDYFYKNVIWSADLPLNINGVYYDEESIGEGMSGLFDPSQIGVTSVNGMQGDVTLTANDVNAYNKGQVDNLLSEAVANEATARQNADNLLSARITAEEQRATSAEEALQSAIDALSETSGEVEQSITEINTTISEIQGDIIEVDNRVSSLETTINNHTTSIENIEGDIETINQSITEINQAIDEIEDDIDALEADNTTNKADIAELKSDVSALKERVSTLETDAANHLVASNIKAGTNISVAVNGKNVTISTNGVPSSEALAALEQQVSINTTNIANEVTNRTNADNSILSTLSSKANITDLLQYVNGVSYDSTTKHINFTNGSTILTYVDATDFIKDGMVDSVEIVNGYLVITFNTDAGKEPISIDITEIFNPNNYYTKTEVNNQLSTKQDASEAFSGDYNDLTHKPTIPVVPTNVSAFTNDAGYLTQHQSLTDYYTKSEIDAALDGKEDASEAFSGDYNDLRNKPTIPVVPTNVSAFTNDAGYLTEHQSLDNYYTKEEVDQAIADVDVSEQLENYYTKDETYNKTEVDQAIADVDISDQLQNYYTKTESDNKFAVKFTDVDDIQLVSQLPVEPDARTLYLIPADNQ